MITIKQIIAARAMLGLSQQELASHAGVSLVALSNIERGLKIDKEEQVMLSIRNALESVGIEFIGNEAGDLVVKLKSNADSDGMITLLIIDDNNSDRKLFKLWLSKQDEKNYRVIEASNAKEGYDALIKYTPACIILDFVMFGKDGFQFLLEMKEKNLHIPPVIFMTGHHNDVIRKDALTLGADLYLDKNMLTKEIFCNAVAAVIGQ